MVEQSIPIVEPQVALAKQIIARLGDFTALTPEDDLLKLVKKDQNINKYLTDKEVRKKIYIKNKLMNIII